MGFYREISKLLDCTIEGEKYERRIAVNDVYDTRGTCPICESTAPRKPACKVQDDPLVEFLHCENCKGYSASQIPTDEYLKDYYSGYYQGADKQITFYGQVDRFSKHIYKYLKIDESLNQIKIMDFGGGDGSIAIQLARIILKNHAHVRKAHVLSVDYQPQDSFDDGEVEFHNVMSLTEADDGYDVVICSAIFEHIPDLDHCLSSIFSLMKSGGYLYARTPYLMPFKKFINVPLLYPMHVHDLGPSFWNRIIERHGLDASIVSSRPPLSETEFRERFLNSCVGFLFKIPCFIERWIRNNPKDFVWQYIAGWEIIYRLK